MSKKYSVNFRSGNIEDVSKSEFDRLRGMARLFVYHERKKRLTLRPAYFSWCENGEWKFQEKETGRVITWRSPEDSCARVERLCACQSSSYIRDEAERRLQIQLDYL